MKQSQRAGRLAPSNDYNEHSPVIVAADILMVRCVMPQRKKKQLCIFIEYYLFNFFQLERNSGGPFISRTEAVWSTRGPYAAFHPTAGTDDGLNPWAIDLHQDCMNWGKQSSEEKLWDARVTSETLLKG